MLKGNKGEWSELYTLLKVLTDGKLFQSDESLNINPENFYEVVKGYKNEVNYRLIFQREKNITISKSENGNELKVREFSFGEFQQVTKVLHQNIIDGKGKTFPIKDLEEFFNKIQVQKVKANSGSKADIKLRIYDHRLALETDLGFSIKSLIGSDSTLFNTGVGNNFIYKVESNLTESITEFNRRTYAPPKKISKLTFRLNELLSSGSTLKFDSIQSRQLWKNLKMIDGDLPEILAWALFFRWIEREALLKKVVELLEMRDPLNFYQGEDSVQRLYEYKIVRFLTESAMGMTSETPWLGEYDSFGGVIFVKQDGDVVCFHIYDINILRKYLLNNTVFEQPATGEDAFNPGNPDPNKVKKYYYGWLYEKDSDLEFKINLQIRFR